MPSLASEKAVRLTLIGGLLCLIALLPPADLSLIHSSQWSQAAPPAGASPEAAVYEESRSVWDDLCSQWREECKQLRSLLPIFMARIPLQGRAERQATSAPALLLVRFFPRKISPPATPDDPYLS